MQVSLRLFCFLLFLGGISASQEKSHKRKCLIFEPDEDKESLPLNLKRDRIEEEEEGPQKVNMKQLHDSGIQFRTLLKISKALARNDDFKGLESILTG
jgi:hypothetical protein